MSKIKDTILEEKKHGNKHERNDHEPTDGHKRRGGVFTAEKEFYLSVGFQEKITGIQARRQKAVFPAARPRRLRFQEQADIRELGGIMELSKRQQQVYDFVKDYCDKHGYCPSLVDIARGLNLSESTIAAYTNTLKQKGYAESEYRVARSLKITEKGMSSI